MNELTENNADRENTNENNNREFHKGPIDDYAARVDDERFSLPPPPPDSSLISTLVHPETHSTMSASLFPCPTSSRNKSQFTSKNLSLTLSNIYALFVVTLGVIIYTGDFFYSVAVSPIYSLVLISIGFVYLLYLIIDINIYKCKLNKIHNKKNENTQNIELQNTQNGNNVFDLSQNHTDLLPKPQPVTASYQFTHGRHSGSFYLKLGATGFAIGHLIHSVLNMATQFHYYQDDNLDNDECLSMAGAIHDIFNPLFCFLQLYFIFNYSNIVILKQPRLAYLGFIHLISSSISFWISTIYRETLLSLYIYANSKYGNTTTAAKHATKDHSEKSLVDLESLYNANCVGSPASIMIFESFSPYLFPFGVEFNILIVAFYYVIWSNIGNPIEEEHAPLDADHHSLHSIDHTREQESHERNIVVHVDCHGSNRGLFFGLLFLVIVATNIILGFVFGNLGGEFIEHGYTVKNGTRLAMHFMMTIAVIIAYKQSRSLDVNEHPISMLDDVFLYICLPAFFMETMLSMVATVTILNVVRCVDFVLMTLQVIMQTIFIIDGLRRCSNSKRLRRNKPGRDAVMFLLIANVCMWLFHTFSYKSPDSVDERYEFYGKVVWTILGHVTLPLMMFYRFHSSVCLADIWDSVYKPGTNH